MWDTNWDALASINDSRVKYCYSKFERLHIVSYKFVVAKNSSSLTNVLTNRLRIVRGLCSSSLNISIWTTQTRWTKSLKKTIFNVSYKKQEKAAARTGELDLYKYSKRSRTQCEIHDPKAEIVRLYSKSGRKPIVQKCVWINRRTRSE